MFVNSEEKTTYVQLSDGREITLEELVKDYERLLRETKVLTAELKVGEWFLIDRDVIEKNKEKIHSECLKAGAIGEAYWQRFRVSEKIANSEPHRYPRRGWTYVFKRDWECKNEQEMREMCKEIGDGMCDEVICDFELQMRICNGESAEDLFEKADKLPWRRVIQLRNGGTAAFGGGANENCDNPPGMICGSEFIPDAEWSSTPYAFKCEPSRMNTVSIT